MPADPKGGLANGTPLGGGPVGENIPKEDRGENGPRLCGYGVEEGPGENVMEGENIPL